MLLMVYFKALRFSLLFILLSVLFSGLKTTLAQAQTLRSLHADDLSETARGLAIGETLHIEGVSLDQGRSTGDALVLQRFRVFTEDAEIVVNGPRGRRTRQPAPDNAYFRGRIEGDALSRAYLVFLQNGATRGIIARENSYWVMNSADAEARGLRRFERIGDAAISSSEREFSCDFDTLSSPAELLNEALSPQGVGNAPEQARAQARVIDTEYNVAVAIDTDYQFLQLFGNPGSGATQTATINYIGDLIGYSSIIYNDNLNTNLVIPHVELRTSSADPWSMMGSCQLFQFGGHWNANFGNVQRTVAHLLSGRTSSGGGGIGVAWNGVLCSGSFNVDTGSCGLSPATGNYGGAYGISQGLSGNFNINNPQVIWDIVAVSHEIGHNFNSPHTHCYGNIGGNANPIDGCSTITSSGYSCYSGTTGLPGIGTVIGGQTNTGAGTIMSYCHNYPGPFSNYGNLSLNFGKNHSFGVQAFRVADRMRAHVESRALSFPSCISETTQGAVLIISSFE